ncbi:RICIN domain-containing protein [Agromyces sp. ISL-38]|uniref:RICIN domain-containing protein n=1 Tax=Agromyces sp. ISL-38 TaxID=2819107 RepID=UPI001BEC59AB|nr:RICIN domain-containing protein [Agromyces sp. ISL-38]MBT2499382.1 RICIN domain-containing protein [Agromyces sp. ISL-38]
MSTSKRKKLATAVGAVLVGTALAVAPLVTAQAYSPTPEVLYQLSSDEPCLKGRGNCVIYGKSAQTPSGRLVTAFEKATAVTYADGTTGAVGQTMPVWASDDHGTTWQHLSDVPAPAFLSDDPANDIYTSNWASPYLYTLPEDVGDLAAGTLLLASVVTGEDEFYREQKAADPNWVPSNDGDRRNLALALYSSVDDGSTWNFENIVATGGWQGGSAGATGVNVAKANVYKQVDPIWEPHLMVHEGQLVAYYSDENDYLGYDAATGVPILDPANDTAADSKAQILVHKTWDGTSAAWSQPVVDVAGPTFAWNGGQQIGRGRPGMTTIAPTTDGKWLLTYEYWGGGANVRYKIADDPLKFYEVGGAEGTSIGQLPIDQGSRVLPQGGSPVTIALPDGRIAYNAAGSGSVWINDGSSTGAWTEYQTTIGAGYSRTLQYVEGTGRLLILQSSWGGPGSEAIIRHADIDFGYTDGAYYRIVNRKTGQVIGTGDNTNDANLGNFDEPDVRLEDLGSVSNGATQYWHLTEKDGGTTTLLNMSGGREASIWTGNATVGQRIGQWVDHRHVGHWNIVESSDGYVKFQSSANPSVYLTGPNAGAPLTLQNALADGSQEWQIVEGVPQDLLKLATSATTRCVAKKAHVEIAVRNDDDTPADVSITTVYGAKSFPSVQPGQSVSADFRSRAGSMPAGTATVSATEPGGPATFDGEVAYAAANCK